MNKLSVREISAYIVGIFDGEGCLAINVERDSRKRFVSESGGWRITPCVQFTNSDKNLVGTVASLLRSIGYHPTIKKYHNGSTHVRLFRLEEVKRFCKEARRYSSGEKLVQLTMFVDKLIPIFDARPPARNGEHRRGWTRELFLRAMTLVDEINKHKRSRRGVRKYGARYFRDLWNSD